MQDRLPLIAQHWLCLSHIRGRQPSFWFSLLAHLDVPIEQLFTFSPQKLAGVGLKTKEIALLTDAAELIASINDWLETNQQNSLVYPGHPHYPARLRQLDSPPLILYCQGNTALLSAPQIAMVGSRRATIQGLNTAKRFAEQLGLAGITVISGLALGIDGAAHQGSYATPGATIAVLGGGLDNVHPRSHVQLARQIITHQGCMISEFAPWETVRAYYFPRRNRLIAAMAFGVVLVEAKIKSGSMITASLAAELGTDVFAVPGNINNPLSEGPHYLIQQGAKLVTCIDDICCEYGWQIEQPVNKDSEACSAMHPAQRDVLACIAAETTSIDIISAQSGLPVEKVMQRLLELELNGQVKAMPGGYIRAGEK